MSFSQARLEADLLLAGPPITAVVKHFDKARGFGFARRLPDGASLHFRGDALRHCGGDVEPGTTMVVRVAPRARGPQIVEVLEIDRTTARPEIAISPARRAFGVLKAIDRRGFCFAALDDDGRDCHISARVAAKVELGKVAIGTKIELEVIEAAQGLVTVSVKPVVI